jgi:hypothetical protein
MKETQRLLNGLIACGAALALVTTLAAQPADQSAAKVVRISGGARCKVGNNDWQPLKLGDVVRAGTVIQTAAKSRVDIAMDAESAAPATAVTAPEAAAAAASSTPVSYQPTTEQNIVRLWENTLMSVDKMTVVHTGADVVSETQLDLKAGHISGSVKKMSAASKFEVKIPNGVAGIRGTFFDIRAEGLIKVLSGSVVLAYVGPNGSVVTQVVMGQQQFDARTGTLSPLPPEAMQDLQVISRGMSAGVASAPSLYSVNGSLTYISPH